MRKRFKRKPRVVWLPTIGFSQAGTQAAEAAPWDFFGDGRYARLSIPATGAGASSGQASTTMEVITFDDTFNQTQLQYDTEYSGASLDDMVKGAEYRLRRCLGRVYCAFSPGPSGENPILPAVEVAAGLMVRDYGEFSALSPTIHPLAGLSTEDPWIWKKHWVLGAFGQMLNPGSSYSGAERAAAGYWPFPASNADYGSIVDGPQIDQKTARTIKRDQRLVMHFAARPIAVGQAGSPEPTGQAGGVVNIWWNMRLLASLKGSAYGNRRNASR